MIIDAMMNLNLLWWGANQTGGAKAWYVMADRHALRTRGTQVRSDGSTFQLATYNGDTGALVSRGTIQGASASSTWSRGQAWASYGFTMAYEATRDPRFLATAQWAANYFIEHSPSDGVPYWDFSVSGADQPRDSSAAAVAAAALINLSQDVTDAGVSARYLGAARHIITTLSSPAYLSRGTGNAAILLHGTYAEPQGNGDTGLTWGDYYFLEALLRYQALMSSAGHSALASEP